FVSKAHGVPRKRPLDRIPVCSGHVWALRDLVVTSPVDLARLVLVDHPSDSQRRSEQPARLRVATGGTFMAGGPQRRVERDTMGELEVPDGAYYGASTMRAVKNFPESGLTPPHHFVRALGMIKQ